VFSYFRDSGISVADITSCFKNFSKETSYPPLNLLEHKKIGFYPVPEEGLIFLEPSFCIERRLMEQIDPEEAFNYLTGINPFQNLDEAALRQAMTGISAKTYSKGNTILHQEGPAPVHLWIIQKGAVKVYFKTGTESEIITDYRGEGDYFGFLSLLHGEKSNVDIVAISDTSCLLMEKETLLDLLKNHPGFAEPFFLSVLNNHLDKPYRQRGKKSLIYAGRDQLLFTTPIGQLISRDIAGISEDISIKEAGEIMSRKRTDYLLLLDSYGLPAGIVTDTDLRDKVVAKARNVDQPVRLIKSVSLVKAEAKEDCAEALFKMVRYNINHLLVIENGKIKGVINSHDLMQVQGGSPLSVVREIEDQQSIAGLIPLSQKIKKMIGAFLDEGAKAGTTVQLMTEMNDRLIRKVLEITERKMGKPPVPYVWLALGSGGRKEQTLKTAPNYALIYEFSSSRDEYGKSNNYFQSFFLALQENLFHLGFLYDSYSHDIGMIPRCQSLEFWKQAFSKPNFIKNNEVLKKVLPFFDGRPIYGKMGLYEEFKKGLDRLLATEDFFTMAASALNQNPAPITLFKNLIVEKEGKYKDLLNLKIKGLLPLTDLARLLALENRIRETATLKRFQTLREYSGLIYDHGEELEYAFEFFLRLRIQHQFEQYSQDQEMHDYIDPERLNLFHKKTLKEAFGLIAKIQDVIKEKYGLFSL
jgi:CBS domain-containing protein